MVAAKPDCTGQRFGRLTVLGKALESKPRGSGRAIPWRLRCDCGKEIELFRSDFDREGMQRSCGCLARNRKAHPESLRKPRDLTGQRFGELTVIRTLAGGHDGSQKRRRATYECRCDCGNTTIKTDRALLAARQRRGWLNCRGSTHLIGAWYPPMPTPMPANVGHLIVKYLHLAEARHFPRVNQEIQDYRRERLERVCWIVVYRRQQGELISDLKEANYLKKSLSCAPQETRRIRRGVYNSRQTQIGDCMAQALSTKDGTKKTVSEILLPVPRKLNYCRR